MKAPQNICIRLVRGHLFLFFHKVIPLVESHLLCSSSCQAVLCTWVSRRSLTWLIFQPQISVFLGIIPGCKVRSEWGRLGGWNREIETPTCSYYHFRVFCGDNSRCETFTRINTVIDGADSFEGLRWPCWNWRVKLNISGLVRFAVSRMSCFMAVVL